MCITNPLKISDFQGNLLHMLLFSQKHAFYFSILRIKEGLSHVQQPHTMLSEGSHVRANHFHLSNFSETPDFAIVIPICRGPRAGRICIKAHIPIRKKDRCSNH